MRIVIVGGDARLKWLAALARERGWTAELVGWPGQAGMDELLHADVIALPLPVSVNDAGMIPLPPGASEEGLNAASVISAMRSGSLCVTGFVPAMWANAFIARGARLFCPQKEDEQYIQENAVLTAEGALSVLSTWDCGALNGESMTILGGGRITRALVRMAAGLDMCVRVAARNAAQLDCVRAMGARTVPLKEVETVLSETDVLINTIPARVLPVSALQKLPSGARVMELASAPGGFDEGEARNRLARRYLLERGLPGRYAPRAAAAALLNSIERTLVQNKEGDDQ